MSNLEKYVDELLIFMSDEIENNAAMLNNIVFNFSFSYTEKYFNAEDKYFDDGEDLTNFKVIAKIKDNEFLKKVLMKALNEQYIKNTAMGNSEFSRIALTENGFRKSKAIKLNRIEKKKKLFTYAFEKLIVPILVSIITAFVASYITTEFKNKNINNELEMLKKDIEWIKQSK